MATELKSSQFVIGRNCQKAMLKSPLYQDHLNLSARMVEFAGWEMPVLYSGILEETLAVRRHAGMFDISHMGRVRVEGQGATDFLQKVTSNNVATLKSSEAQYSLLPNEQGGVIDDIIVYREAEERYLVVINASNTEKDLTWLRLHLPETVSLTEITAEYAMIAVQGPEAPRLVEYVAGTPLTHLSRFQFLRTTLKGGDAYFCRTGYTGEDGFEIIVEADKISEVWTAFHDIGVAPCGLGSRDVLRVEAGYPLYGHEIDDTTSPVEASLMWVVKPAKGNFIGSSAIAKVKSEGASRKLMGFVTEGRNVPRQGYTILVNEKPRGIVTSGVFSPMKECGLGMAYVETEFAVAGQTISVDVRGRSIPAKLVPKKDLLVIAL